MSKEFKDIDELFKSTIGMGSATAPTHVKNKILSKTNVGGNWWLFGAGLLLMIAISATVTVINIPKNNDITHYQLRTNIEPITVDNYITHFIKNSACQIDELTVSRPVDITNINSQHDDILKEEISSMTNDQKTKSALSKPQQNVNKKPSRDLVTNTQIISTSISPVKKVTQEGVTMTNKKETSIDESKIPNTPVEKQILLTNSIKNSTVINTDSALTEIINIEKSEIKTSYNSEDRFQKNLRSKTKDIVNDSSNVLGKSTKKIDSTKTDIKIENEPENKKGYWMLGLSGGPNINNANYTSSEFTQPLSKLHNEKLGYFGQIYGQYVTSTCLMVNFGLGIEKQSYNTTFLTTDTTYNFESNTVFSHYIYDDSTNMIIDSVFVTKIDSTAKTSLKNHSGITNSQYLQIPFRLGCQIERNKWVFGADLGVQINYLLKSNGTYFLNNEVLSLENNTIFKRTTIIYSVGGNLKYNVLNNLYLSTNMRYFPSFQNYYENTYAKRSIGSVSFGFGLTYKW